MTKQQGWDSRIVFPKMNTSSRKHLLLTAVVLVALFGVYIWLPLSATTTFSDLDQQMQRAGSAMAQPASEPAPASPHADGNSATAPASTPGQAAETGSGAQSNSADSQSEGSQTDGNRRGHLSSDPDSYTDSIRFYAMMDPNGPVPPPLREFVKTHPAFRSHMGFRPMLQWYVWANKPKPLIPSLLFILMFSVVVWSLIPAWMKRAQTQCRERFWASFFIGGLVMVITLWLLRTAVVTLFGWPLGMLIGGLLQFALMAGLGVVSTLIGESMAFYLHLDQWPLIGARPDTRRFATLFLGALICALLLQIPGIALLPKIGTRLVGLLAVLGLGSLYRTRPVPSA